MTEFYTIVAARRELVSYPVKRLVHYPERTDLTVSPVRRNVYGAGETSRVVYDGTYTANAWTTWGQENVHPFGPEYVKTFGDLP